jgi:hypothetical protein
METFQSFNRDFHEKITLQNNYYRSTDFHKQITWTIGLAWREQDRENLRLFQTSILAERPGKFRVYLSPKATL